MPYIGNTIRAADDYRLIDDISSGFNGSETSFALQVAGSAPVPFPKSPQQVLISVNGVIQEPDPTGASGFNLVGTNIVFSSPPTNGHAFFGIIYATADYLNSGGNFPSGSLGAPSITFVGDEDTGIYRKGSGSIAFVANSTEIANTDSNGITISSGNLILGDSSGASDDRIKLGASGDLQIYHNGTHDRIDSSGAFLILEASNHIFRSNGGTEDYAKFLGNGAVELYHNGTKRFETTSAGVSVAGTITSSSSANVADGHVLCQLDSGNGRLKLLNGSDGITVDIQGSVGNVKIVDGGKFQAGDSNDLEIYHDGNHSRISDEGSGSLLIQTNGGNIQLNKGTSENMLVANTDGSVDLYYDNSKKFETTNTGIQINGSNSTGSSVLGDFRFKNAAGTQHIIYEAENNLMHFLDNNKAQFGTDNDLQIYHDGNSRIDHNGSGVLVIRTQGTNEDIQLLSARDILLRPQGGENGININGNGAVQIYHNNVEQFTTLSNGVRVTNGHLQVNQNDGMKLIMGANDEIEFSHTGSENLLDMTNQLFNYRIAGVSGSQIKLEPRDGHSSAVFKSNNAVELYYDNAKKFSTESYGVSLHGLTLSTQSNILYYNSSTGQVSYQAPSGGVNTPAFFAYADGDQAQSNDSLTLLQADAEDFDVGGCYNTSNYRFTPNEAGKYVLYGQALVDAGSGNFTRARCGFRKNGSQLNETDLFLKIQSQTWHLATVTSFMIVVANGSSDYFEFFSRGRTYSGGNVNVRGGTDRQSYFAGYKLIE